MIRKYVPLISKNLPPCPQFGNSHALEVMSRAYFNGYLPGYIEARCKFCKYSQLEPVFYYVGYDLAVDMLKREWGKGVS